MKKNLFQPRYLKTFENEGIEAVYLFGSRAQGLKNPLADYDYAVLTKSQNHHRGDLLYDKLYEIFSAVSPRTLKNDIIDIVFLRDAPLELRFHVIRYGKILYEKDRKARLHFEEQTTLFYCDFRPLLNEMDQTILASL